MKSFSTKNILVAVTVFAIAMAMLESAVVIYLRYLYFPEGFKFPMVAMGKGLAVVEFWREVGTMIMLVAIGWLAGRNLAQRLAYFIYSFAIWDIFYYVWLKVFLDWPESFLTWDILFLIPMPWVGPVITPLLVTVLMILLAGLILYHDSKGRDTRLNWRDWSTMSLGSFVIILSWVWDYTRYVSANTGWDAVWTLGDEQVLFGAATSYVPVQFEWLMFSVGFLIVLLGLGAYHCRKVNCLKAKDPSTRIQPVS